MFVHKLKLDIRRRLGRRVVVVLLMVLHERLWVVEAGVVALLWKLLLLLLLGDQAERVGCGVVFVVGEKLIVLDWIVLEAVAVGHLRLLLEKR